MIQVLDSFLKTVWADDAAVLLCKLRYELVKETINSFYCTYYRTEPACASIDMIESATVRCQTHVHSAALN